MSDPRAFSPFALSRLTLFRWRQRHRIGLSCEGLETRQLLSTLASQVPDVSQLTAQPSLQVLPFASSGPTGMTPVQIRNAYGVSQIKFSNGTVGGYGLGQTIAIVTAYNDPNIQADLSTFDRQFSLPDPWSFTVKNLGGTTSDPGWALETALDVEWAHTLAPGANILLVEAASSSLNDMFNAVRYASQQPGVSVVSMSWGASEFWGQSGYDSLFTTPAGHSGVTYVAASGDSGAWNGPTYPASSPNVLSVGGTALSVSGSGGTYLAESGWDGSTGGFSGFDSYWSFYEPAPSYQVAAQAASGLSYGVRTTPDVSFNASPNSGVAVYDSIPNSGQSGWFQLGGTSAAAPAWAGLIAVADQGLATGGKGPLSGTQAQSQLYALPSSDFHDVTSGSNGYLATTGYDLVTGLGSPKANLVVAGILSANGVSQGPSASQTVATTSTKTSSASSTRFEVIVTTPVITGSGGGSSSVSVGSGIGTGSGFAASALVTGQSGTASQLGALLPTLTATSSSTQASPAASAAVSQSSASTAIAAAPAQSLLPSASSAIRYASDEAPAVSDWLPEEGTAVQAAPPTEQQPGVDPAPAGDPAPAAEPPAVAPPIEIVPDQPIEGEPLGPFDQAPSDVSLSLAASRIELPAGPTTAIAQAGTVEDQPRMSLAAAAGAVLVAAGGYRLVIGRSDRIRRRWSPVRFFT
jgi:hypothetical protein